MYELLLFFQLQLFSNYMHYASELSDLCDKHRVSTVACCSVSVPSGMWWSRKLRSMVRLVRVEKHTIWSTWFRKQMCLLLLCYIQGTMLHIHKRREMIHLLCQRFGVFVFMCSSCGWAQRIWNWFRGLVWQQRLCCMGYVMSLKSQRPRAVFQVPVFCVRYLQLPDKLLVSLKAGCECQLCSAPCCFNVYPVNRAGTKITQITGTLVKWHWLLTQKCIYSEMLGICWTTRWYF